jgi:hypothetical protein
MKFDPDKHRHDPATLNEIDAFADNCLYVTREQRTLIALGAALSHDPRAGGTAARFAVRGPKQTGKSTVMDVAWMLSHNGWMSNPTPAALRAFYNTEGEHTLFVEEASKYFGESGLLGKTLDLYRILADGWQKRATLSFSVNRVLTNVSSYGVAWCAGIGEAIPSDIVDRSVRIDMEAKPEDIEKWDTLDDDVTSTGFEYQEQLHEWMMRQHDYLVWFNRNKTTKLHRRMTNRRRQIYGPLAAIAYAAGGEWPKRFMEAFLAIGINSGKVTPTINQQIVLDTEKIIIDNGYPDFIYTIDLIENLPPRELYQSWTEEYTFQVLTMAIGPTRLHRGDKFDGTHWQGKGRDTQKILDSAENIKQNLWPEEEDDETQPEDDELGGPV